MEPWGISLSPFSMAEFKDMNLIQDDDLLVWDLPVAPHPYSESFTIMSSSIVEGGRADESVEFSLEEVVVSSLDQQSLGENPQHAARLDEITLNGKTTALFFENPLVSHRVQDEPSKPSEADSSEISSSSGSGTMSPEGPIQTMAPIHETVPLTAGPPKPKLGRPPKIPHALALAPTASATPKKGKNPRARRNLVPEEKKDDEYWRRRDKNNEAVRKSRDKKKEKRDQSALDKIVLKNEELEREWNELRIHYKKLRLDAIRQGIKLSDL